MPKWISSQTHSAFALSSSQLFFSIFISLLPVSLLSFSGSPFESSASAQTVTRNSDGTVEVTDTDQSPPLSSSSHRKIRNRSSQAKSYSGGSAYSKRIDGVMVRRNADGTVEVGDADQAQPRYLQALRARKRKVSQAKSSSSGAAYSKRIGGVMVKRNADGTVEVGDNSSGSSSAGGQKGSSH